MGYAQILRPIFPLVRIRRTGIVPAVMLSGRYGEITFFLQFDNFEVKTG